jgi:hypothetical protein
VLFHAFGDFDLVADFPDQVRNVSHRQRIGAVDFQQVARLQRFQPFASSMPATDISARCDRVLS